MTDAPRPTPCGSCPYRRDVPSGVWAAEEYERLPRYDGPIHEQAMSEAVALFLCHQADGHLCAGWAGHRDPADLLAIRLAILRDELPPDVVDYRTDAALFATGAEAAEHGKREIDFPGYLARSAARKVAIVRALRGDPVRGDDPPGATRG